MCMDFYEILASLVEIVCPCTKDDLNHLINFLYKGEINCENENDAIKIQENLSKIFGFPENLHLKNSNQWMTQIHCSANADIFSEIKSVVTVDSSENISNQIETIFQG